jgi:SAM-dependent methyltransferase
MNPITNLARRFSQKARSRRAELFRKAFVVGPGTRILDIGSEDGSNIRSVLAGSDYRPENVFISDLEKEPIKLGREKYGFNAVLIDEDGYLPFADGAFDIVYCSSAIEHVTVPHSEVWKYRNGGDFRAVAMKHQKLFADEIRRVGRRYYVQTPAAGFPIESHTWLPLAGYLPRETLLPVMKAANRFWPKKSEPDFNLLNAKELAELFPEAHIARERIFGMTKSLMALRTD